VTVTSCQLCCNCLSATYIISNVTHAYCGCYIATYRYSQVHDTDSGGGVDYFFMDMEQLSSNAHYICVYMHTICIYMHIHAYCALYTRKHAYYMHINMHIYMHIHAYCALHIHMRIHAYYMHIHAYTCILRTIYA
jgi:hypothetical protein